MEKLDGFVQFSFHIGLPRGNAIWYNWAYKNKLGNDSLYKESVIQSGWYLLLLNLLLVEQSEKMLL